MAFQRSGLVKSCILLAAAVMIGAAGTMGAMKPAFSQSFLDALALAYKTSPVIQAQILQLETSNEGLTQAQGLRRPSIIASYKHGFSHIDSNLEAFEGTENDDRAQISINQTLFDSGKSGAEIAAARAEIERARAAFIDSEQQLLSLAAQAYVNMMRDIGLVELREKNVARLESHLNASRERFEVGELTRTDVAQAESSLAGGKAELVAAKSSLQESMASFQRYMGRQPEGLSEPAFPFQTPENLDELLAQARTHNPALLQAVHNLEAARLAKESAIADLLPTAQLEGSLYREEDELTDGSKSNGASISATVSLPLYQAGVVESRLRASRNEYARANYALEDARRQMIETVTAAYQTWRSGLARIEAVEEEVTAASLALEGVSQEAELGLRTVLDVLNAEQDRLSAQVDLILAKRDLVVAQIELNAARGQMTAKELGLDVPLYDPNIHLNKTDGRWFGWGDDRQLDFGD